MYSSGFVIQDTVDNNQKKICTLCKKFYFISGKMSIAELWNDQSTYFSIIQTLEIAPLYVNSGIRNHLKF